MEGCELEFTPEAMRLIAEKAMERDTGARALRAVTEEIMLDVMFHLPEMKNSGKWVVNASVARGEEPLFSAAHLQRRKESA
jgi:ATP-dependent Clp protease ATP-binding subunit ClpX